MPVVYLQDVTKKIENKFLGINVIAQRGRQINQEASPFFQAESKPSVLAIDEFVAGKIGFREVGTVASDTDDLHIFSVDESEEVGEQDDFQTEEVYVDQAITPELDEAEEGL